MNKSFYPPGLTPPAEKSTPFNPDFQPRPPDSRWPARTRGLEYRKFRVRGHIKSFRDLEIYKQTTQLCSEIFQLELPANLKNRKLMQAELELLGNLAKYVPKFIAESYGDKFDNRTLAYAKLEKSMRLVSDIIAKLDFLIAMADHQETKQQFVKLIGYYQTQRRKILNLKRAWLKIDAKFHPT